jgi:hypothetical protein
MSASENAPLGKPEMARPRKPKPERKPIGPVLRAYLPAVALVISLGALAASVVFYTEGQRTYRDLSGDIAEVKVSLTLLAQRGGTGAAGQQVIDLQNRLAILEENWRSQPSAPVAVPAAPPPAAASGPSTDCIPEGIAFVMTGADRYAICNTPVSVALSMIENDTAVLEDGKALAKGVASPLPDTQCTITLVSSDAATGFAELRVNC